MILKLLVLVSCCLLVSCQSGAPVAAQTYPIYQQNGFPNPFPNQPNEFTPYHQAFKIQNPSLLSETYPSIIRQVLLNKFQSNPPTQSNLDPKLRSYGLNFDRFQNNQITPNLLNKYLASSPYLNTNDTNREKVDGKNTKETSKSNRKKSSKKKRKHERRDNTEASQSIVKAHEDSQQNTKTTDPHRDSRRKSRKHKSHNTEPEIKNKAESNTERTRKRKHKEDRTNENQPNLDLDMVGNAKPKKRRRHRRPKQYLDNVEEKPTLREKKENFNLVQYSGTKEENRFIRNSQSEANETRLSVKRPEDVASASPSNMLKFDSPMMSKIFPNYQQFYQSLANNMTVNDNRPQNTDSRKPKRNRTHRKRTNPNNKNSTQTIPKINLKVETVTTEKPVTTTDNIQMTINSTETGKSLKSNDETKVNEDSRSVSSDEDPGHTPDLNENMNYPYEGYFDDYYPQFTDSAYNANNKENYVKVLDNGKYYYKTDEEIKNSDVLPERKIKDYEINKHYDDIEERLLKIEDSDNEIEFKTPPSLEKPDFETRPIIRSDMRPEIYYKKEESPRYVGDKSIEAKQKANFMPAKELETVYAKPKVVKYGVTLNSEERMKGDWSDTVTFDGLTYVYAKPMGNSKEEW